MQKPLKIGHRGAKAHLTENTIASVKKALELGVDGIEIDVHLCASGELVVFHDFTLDRITNGFGEVSNHTLTELKSLKVDGEFSIPTLLEVLDTIDKKCLINIELKGEDAAAETCKVVSHYIENKGWAIDQFIISSFQFQELEAVFKINSNFRLGILTEATVIDALEFAKSVNAYAIHPNFDLLSKQHVEMAQYQGYKVYTWTVNDDESIKRITSYGVDAIISDNPERL